MGAEILTIFTGASGAGKDSVMEGFLKDPRIQKYCLERVITCADREMRKGEIDGREYHFVSREELRKMCSQGLLVEPITPTGTSNKATPKCEIARLLNGEKLVWRIDLSRAADIASGEFFKKLFPECADTLQTHTLILFVTAPKSQIEERRKERDGDRYNPDEYIERDKQEFPFLEVLQQKATNIQNLDGKLHQAIDDSVKAFIGFLEKSKE